MDMLEALEDDLWQHGIQLDQVDLGHGLDGYTRVYDNGEVYIAVNPCLPRLRKTAIAYHEVGHLVAGITGQIGKDERRANMWTFKKLIPIEKLIEGLKKLPSTVFELAEDMGVDPQFLCRFLQIQSATCGYLEHGEYVIGFDPVILYNWKTGQMWP